MIEEIHIPAGAPTYGEKADASQYPTMMTAGCCEDMLYDNPQQWVEEFKEKGISYSVFPWKYEMGSYDQKTGRHTRVESWMPYPLDDREADWVEEGADESFTDGSGAWVNFANTVWYKDKKYLAPFVEYSPEYDPKDPYSDSITDPVRLDERINECRQWISKHRKLVKQALEAEGLDGFQEYHDEYLDGVYIDHYSGGFRTCIDLRQAMEHFKTFDNYKRWWRTLCNTIVIKELPV